MGIAYCPQCDISKSEINVNPNRLIWNKVYIYYYFYITRQYIDFFYGLGSYKTIGKRKIIMQSAKFAKLNIYSAVQKAVVDKQINI